MAEKVLNVSLNTTPRIRVRVPEIKDHEKLVISKDFVTRTLWEDKEQFPFKLDNRVVVKVTTDKRIFSFVVPRGYVWDGASIPKFLWSLVGSKEDLNFLTASMLHDFLLEDMKNIYNINLGRCMPVNDFRKLTTNIFKFMLRNSDVGKFKAWVMASCVQMWQCTGSRKQWRELKNDKILH